MHVTTTRDDASERRNYRVLLAQGVLVGGGFELNSVRLVLPYFYTALGAPLIFAGLIVPVFQATKLFAQLFVAPAVHAARRNRGFIAAALLAAALALGVICLLVGVQPSVFMTLVFLAMVGVLSIGTGVSSLAFQDMIGHILPEARRRRLLFVQSGLVGVAAAAIAWAAQEFLPASTSRQAHTELMWAGVVLLVLAAIMVGFVREPLKPRPAAPLPSAQARGALDRVVGNLKASLGRAAALPWFRRFLAARALLLSIELAMPFYAIHAATLHAQEKTGLAAFLIASSLGLAVGGVVWPRLGAGSIKTVLAAATALAAGAGALAVALDLRVVPQTTELHAAVFILVAFAAQGVQNGRKIYVIGMAPRELRPHCIAAANVVTGLTAIALSAALGAIAQICGAVWPIYVVIALNLAALAAIAKLPGRGRESGG